MKRNIPLKKGLAYSAVGGLSLMGVLAIVALTPRKWTFPNNETCEITIYLSSDGLHTNIFVPVETSVFNWKNHLNLSEVAQQPSHNYRYLQFGWGERIFYTENRSWDTLRVLSAARALFYWQNTSAMFVKGHTNLQVPVTDDFKCLRLSKANYLALSQFLDGTFATNPQGQKQRVADGADLQSGFYEAKGQYSILNTCNSWTANGLRAANVNTPLWAGLADSVMFHAHNACECNASPNRPSG